MGNDNLVDELHQLKNSRIFIFMIPPLIFQLPTNSGTGTFRNGFRAVYYWF